jgi:hypothetical protein
MRRYQFLLILIFFAGAISAVDETITQEQDESNKKYLILLNDNLITTIDMLQIFNDKGQEIYLIEQGDIYNSFLFDLTMQCSNLIDKIRQAETFGALERELQIRALIATIKADVEYYERTISDELQEQNSIYLMNVEKNLQAQTSSVLQAIIKEEQVILEKGEVTNNYFRLHTHHFIFSLLSDFIIPSDYLSRRNEDYLVQIVQSVDAAMQKE